MMFFPSLVLSWIRLFLRLLVTTSPAISKPPIMYRLPDLLVKFPWKRNLSEFYKEVKAESSAWTESFHLFDDEGLKGFNLCDFSSLLHLHNSLSHDVHASTDLLASLAYSPRERGALIALVARITH
jgi:hypothetical protein